MLKIYNYFNQYGDGFFRELLYSDIKIKGFENEFKYLSNIHYFNILLAGFTGSGKSTFINTIIGEKKAFTLSGKSTGTYRSNYYIHKKYPIKLIDVCGFADGTEGESNFDSLNSIYNQDNNNIAIDQYFNDIFTFFGDKRNNIHLLIYFNIYNNKYDVLPGEKKFINLAKSNNIPIIFVVNKCEEKIFNNEDEMEELKETVNDSRKGTIYEDCKTIFINCIQKKGLDELLSTIFEEYEKNIIPEENLSKLKSNDNTIEYIQDIFKNSFFFGDFKPDDILLNDSLLTSVLDIKTLIVKFAGYYEGKLTIISSIYVFFNILYNKINKDENNNFFPLLTNLVQKIYKNFGFEKTQEECNNFIKKNIKDYFKLEIIKDNNDDDSLEGNTENVKGFSDEFDKYKFLKDYSYLGKLFWNSDLNYRLEENIESDWLINDNIEDNEKKFKDKLFTEEEDDDELIESDELLNYIKKDFGLYKDEVNLSPKIIMKIKIFYISYICNELIDSICGQLNKKGFKYKSISDFYYNVSFLYNDAINGFNGIREDLRNEKENLENYIELKKQGIGEKPKTIIVKNKD